MHATLFKLVCSIKKYLYSVSFSTSAMHYFASSKIEKINAEVGFVTVQAHGDLMSPDPKAVRVDSTRSYLLSTFMFLHLIEQVWSEFICQRPSSTGRSIAESLYYYKHRISIRKQNKAR